GDVGATIRLPSRHQVRGEPHALAEGKGPRLVGDERVGTGVDREAVAADRVERAAEAYAGLEELDRGAALDRAQGRREPRDPAADDRDARHVAVLRTTSASMATKAGWSLTVLARTKPRPSDAAVARASTSRS